MIYVIAFLLVLIAFLLARVVEALRVIQHNQKAQVDQAYILAKRANGWSE